MESTKVEVQSHSNFSAELKTDTIKRIVEEVFHDCKGDSTKTSAPTNTTGTTDAEAADDHSEYLDIIQKLGDDLKKKLDEDATTKDPNGNEQWLVIAGTAFYLTWVPFKDAPKCVVIINDKLHVYLARF